MSKRKIARLEAGTLAKFSPEGAHVRIAQTEAMRGYAERIKDWPLLEKAVDQKIKEQRALVSWWRVTVTPRHRPGRGGTKKELSADRGVIPLPEAERLTGIPHQDVSRWTARLADALAYREQQLGAAYREAMLSPADNHRAQGTGENEWYTPPEYLDAARAVMGAIDLDPATSAHGQKTVQATHHYTRADDGLAQEWHGRVWLNPPYSQPEIGAFIAKWGEEVGACRVHEAIVLTHNYTDTAWFHLAESFADRICFTRGRIRFRDARDQECAPTQGQVFFYAGRQPDRFATIFGAFGFIR